MDIIDRLDSLAERLENKGLMKEASELDVVTNTLEKVAYRASSDGKIKAIERAIQFLRNGKVEEAKSTLAAIETAWKEFIRWYPIAPVQEAYNHYKSGLESITLGSDLSQGRDQAIKHLQAAAQSLQMGEQEINRAQMTGHLQK